jgi:hypothetical protein
LKLLHLILGFYFPRIIKEDVENRIFRPTGEKNGIHQIRRSSNVQFTLVQTALNRSTVQPFTESEDTRCCVTAVFPPEDEHVNARNMSRIIV